MIVIYGASGHGKVIHDILTSQNKEVEISFVDDADKGGYFYHSPAFLKSELSIDNHQVIIAIGNNKIRKRISETLSNFTTAISPSATISPSVTIEEGTVIMPNVSCNADSRIGKHVILNTSCSIDHDCVIDDFAHISPNASLAGNVKIGEGTHIGIGASIIQGIKIGKFATIGAGTVIINDVPDGATVVGVPGKIIKLNNGNE